MGSVAPSLVYSPHPLLAQAGRMLYSEPFLPSESIARYVMRVGLDLANRPVMLHLNDKLIPRGEWASTYPRSGDIITVRVVAQGGGGDSNKTLRTVLTLVVLIAAQRYDMALAKLMGITGANAGGIAAAIAATAGAMAVNALLPPQLPQLANASISAGDESPTYSLSGGGNAARLFGPMSVVVGEHRLFPDDGATSYTEFAGEDQYLYQVFHFGLADVVLSDFRIGNTALSSFSGYEIEESGANGKLTLFPTNVDTQTGGALTQAASYITKTSSVDATELGVEIAGYLFYAGTSGIEARSVDIDIEYRLVGGGAWLPFVGGVATVNITNSTKKPLRLGYRLRVASGQYEVRLRRVTADETDDRATSDISWYQLLTYQADSATDYAGQKRVALKIKASGQLNGRVDQLNALASAKYDVWNGSSWVNQASSNPAWQILWWARGKFNGTRLLCGGGLPDSEIDIDNLKEFGAWCDAKGLTCNLVLDREMNLGDLINAIARCGRGTVTWASGKMGVVWDASNQPSVAMFGMSNIRRDTFSVSYADAPEYDEIIGRFVNPANEWQQDTVRIPLHGVTNPVRSKTVDLWGCTDESQAGREIALLAAEHDHRYRRISWQSDLEGRVCDRGDVVTLAHDLTKWAYSGRLVEGGNTQLMLERVVPFSAGLDHYVRVRYPDGAEYIWDLVYTGATDTLLLVKPIKKTTWAAGAPKALGEEIEPTVYNGHYYKVITAGTTGTSQPSWPFTPGATVVDGTVAWQEAGTVPEYAPDDDPAYAPFDYIWFFQPQATPGKKVKILSVRPVSQYMIEFIATDEDESFYIRESDAYTYITPTGATGATPTLSNLVVDEHLIRVGNSYMVRLILTWDVSGEYSGARVNIGLDGAAPQNVGGSTTRRFEVDVQPGGTAEIEVVGLNYKGLSGATSRVTKTYAIAGTGIQISDVQGFAAELEDYGVRLSWFAVPDAVLRDYELRRGATYATATLEDRLTALEKRIYTKLAGTYTYWIVARDQNEATSLNPVSVAIIIAGPSAPSVSSRIEGSDAVLEWTESTGDFAIVEYKLSYGTDYAASTYLTTIKSRAWRITAAWVGTRRFWVVGIDAAGNEGTPGSIDVVITAPGAPTLSHQVVDNNVLLYFTGSAGTLPIASTELRKGATYATAVVVGMATGSFAPLFETDAGQYTYWAVSVDSAGNYGAPSSIMASVNEPPDYVLKQSWVSIWSGTKTNALIKQDGHLLAPVNTTETWAQHFANNGFTTIQGQINAGFPFYLQPSLNSAAYEEVFDYGTVLAGTMVSAILNSTVLAGSISITPIISVRKLATDAWTTYSNVWQVFATNFQYVKVRLDFTAAAGDDMLELNQLEVRLDVKKKYDGGMGVASASDTNGTWVPFNRAFIDVDSVTVTPRNQAGIDGIDGLWDFVDTPCPTGMYVFLYRRSNGARLSGDFSWDIGGY